MGRMEAGFLKIVSGGQTGVDRAALDAALEVGIKVGGWCPEGRLAEDGVIGAHYPLEELRGAGYAERTRQNVIDSDGTLIIYFSYPSGGTEQTILRCIEANRPYLLIDAEELTPERASQRVMQFIARGQLSTLNVAGPRASGDERAYPYAYQVLQQVCSAL